MKNIKMILIGGALILSWFFAYQIGMDAAKTNPAQLKPSFKFDANKMSDITNVMIVAHPDDEILWGGSQLFRDGNYVVICLTNKTNKVREKEFQNVMKKTNTYGVMLSYPDNPNNEIDNWKERKQAILEDIRYIVTYKEYQKIVTHNPEGEYGHIQHRTLNNLVSDVCIRKHLDDQLYYFNHYYSDEERKALKQKIPSADTSRKEDIMKDIYISQKKTFEATKKMIPYESLIPYEEWYFIR